MRGIQYVVNLCDTVVDGTKSFDVFFMVIFGDKMVILASLYFIQFYCLAGPDLVNLSSVLLLLSICVDCWMIL